MRNLLGKTTTIKRIRAGIHSQMRTTPSAKLKLLYIRIKKKLKRKKLICVI